MEEPDLRSLGMVERVADAISDVRLLDGGCLGSEIGGDALLAVARVAIEAMRMPTEAMMEAGLLDGEAGYYADSENVRPIWKAMIDAALQAEGGSSS